MIRANRLQGFVTTLDAIVALLLFLSVLVLVSKYEFSESSASLDQAYLKQVSMDSLAVLEKTGKLHALVQTSNLTPIQEILSAEPSNICSLLEVKNENAGLLEFVVSEPHCENYGSHLQVTSRSFACNNEFYSAKLSSWFKGSEEK